MLPDQFRQHLKDNVRASADETAKQLAENASMEFGLMRFYQGRYQAMQELLSMIEESYRTVI